MTHTMYARSSSYSGTRASMFTLPLPSLRHSMVASFFTAYISAMFYLLQLTLCTSLFSSPILLRRGREAELGCWREGDQSQFTGPVLAWILNARDSSALAIADRASNPQGFEAVYLVPLKLESYYRLTPQNALFNLKEIPLMGLVLDRSPRSCF